MSVDISDGQPSESDSYDEIMSLLENIDGLSVSGICIAWLVTVYLKSFKHNPKNVLSRSPRRVSWMFMTITALWKETFLKLTRIPWELWKE